MKSITVSVLVLAGLTAPALFAQKWEIGGGAGGGFYTSQDVRNPVGNGAAKFASNIAAAAWVGNNSGNLLGGELRYDYQRGNAEVSGSGQNATFGAQSHALHYDLLFHFAPRSSPVRPFVAVGGGVKIYQGMGTEVAFQPLSRLALLTKTSDVLALGSVGAGVKFKVSRGIGFRAEFHDFITPFPKKVITPAANSKIGGWIQDFVVTFGISLLF